jgi:hypothetical protein
MGMLLNPRFACFSFLLICDMISLRFHERSCACIAGVAEILGSFGPDLHGASMRFWCWR